MEKNEKPTNTEEPEVLNTENIEQNEEETVENNHPNTETEEETEELKAPEDDSAGQNDDSLETKMEKVTEELGEMKDKYLRLYAEFDNYRKRTNKERLDLMKVASEDMVKALLPAVDDFQRALKMANDDSNDETIPEGIVLVIEKLMKALTQKGLKIMETDGEVFDPELHEALTKIPAPSEDMKGKIVDTVEKGYYLNNKIIRYPKVVIGQ